MHVAFQIGWRVGFESVGEGSRLAGIGIVCLDGCVEGEAMAVFLVVAEELGEVLADCGLEGEGLEGDAFGWVVGEEGLPEAD